MRWQFFVCLLGCLHWAAGCGGEVRASGSATTDAGVEFDAAGDRDARHVRVPLRHRPSSTSCPVGRGPARAPGDACSLDSGYTDCMHDEDCADGVNGRCVSALPLACATRCSYDTCADDTSCPNGEPCECRPDESAAGSNSCVSGGNCRVDADCGSDGYCSPSHVGELCDCPRPELCGPGGHCEPGPCACGDACGHAYYCHTPDDACIDDSDCAPATCNYDTFEKRWTCATCWALP